MTTSTEIDIASGEEGGPVIFSAVVEVRPEVAVPGYEGLQVTIASPVSTDDEGQPTEQTKAKIADPSGNVIEIKTYADVASALEISPYSYPEAIEHGN